MIQDWQARLAVRVMRGRAPDPPACNHCAGLSGFPPIADAPTCMPCVLRIGDRTRRGLLDRQLVLSAMGRWVWQ